MTPIYPSSNASWPSSEQRAPEQPTKWPPPRILKWIQGGAVNAETLADEMREWADFIDPKGAS